MRAEGNARTHARLREQRLLGTVGGYHQRPAAQQAVQDRRGRAVGHHQPSPFDQRAHPCLAHQQDLRLRIRPRGTCASLLDDCLELTASEGGVQPGPESDPAEYAAEVNIDGWLATLVQAFVDVFEHGRISGRLPGARPDVVDPLRQYGPREFQHRVTAKQQRRADKRTLPRAMVAPG